jgi:glycosyltransferase involved in cell wall biosynthesis
MGEHVRMTAEALGRAQTPYGIFDFDVGVANKQADEGAFPLVESNRFRANLFHVNADQMLYTYCKLKPEFFRNCYNIGYWAWELSRCPAAWAPITNMVDEIWAPSTFVRDAFAAVTSKPVVHMPLCVELPPFRRLPRSLFGLPEGKCLFLFVFDFHSFIARKNPLAALRAFQRAFPSRLAPVGLVIKVMNGNPEHPVWHEMMNLMENDRRIHIINEVMPRQQVLALVDCCDVFVSLHRAEGFGRGPAEAMYLGKPVIVTNYSGNTDFTREGAAFLVDYDLVPIEKDQYVCPEGQVWASADEQHAAHLMRQIVEGSENVAAIAARGRAIIRNEFSPEAVGSRMTKRLREVGAIDC